MLPIVKVRGLLGDDEWGRTAVHGESGLVTLRQLALHAINHIGDHLAFVREKRRALGLPEA